MFRNYFKTAYRNLIKNKIFSGINIFGLTIGLTSCILITLYIEHELTYDDFEQKGSRIARVIMEYSFGGSSESQKGNYTSVRVAPVFRKNFPEEVFRIKQSLMQPPPEGIDDSIFTGLPSASAKSFSTFGLSKVNEFSRRDFFFFDSVRKLKFVSAHVFRH